MNSYIASYYTMSSRDCGQHEFRSQLSEASATTLLPFLSRQALGLSFPSCTDKSMHVKNLELGSAVSEA